MATRSQPVFWSIDRSLAVALDLNLLLLARKERPTSAGRSRTTLEATLGCLLRSIPGFEQPASYTRMFELPMDRILFAAMRVFLPIPAREPPVFVWTATGCWEAHGGLVSKMPTPGEPPYDHAFGRTPNHRAPNDRRNTRMLQALVSSIPPHIGPWSQDVSSFCLCGLLEP